MTKNTDDWYQHIVFEDDDEDESEFAHWGETKESMRGKAIDLFSRLLKEAREKQGFPQDGSKGQAEAYHQTLLNSLK